MNTDVRVRDAMSTQVLEIPEDASALAAATRMATSRVNSLVVRPVGKHEPFGIVTSTDVVDALAEGRDLAETPVSEIATAPLVTVTPGVPLASAARLMKRTGLRHLAVFNGKNVVGVLSAFDIAKALAKERGALRAGEFESERTSVVEP
jgi:IMP dehydrogenase